MTPENALAILQSYQLWRRGFPPYDEAGYPPSFTPTELGKAIDLAIDCLCWHPMDTAPKDGSRVLLKFKNELPEKYFLRTEQYEGLEIVARCPVPELGWQFAAPVGQGGFIDEWFIGWKPL